MNYCMCRFEGTCTQSFPVVDSPFEGAVQSLSMGAFVCIRDKVMIRHN